MPMCYNTYFNVLSNRNYKLIKEVYKIPCVNDVFTICYNTGSKRFTYYNYVGKGDDLVYTENNYRKYYYKVIEIVDDTLKCERLYLFMNENDYLFYRDFPIKNKKCIYGFSVKKYWCIYPKKQNSIVIDNSILSWFPD